ncbi:MAG: hypothetical protein ACK56I_15950, partial [bacterium]
MQRALALAQAGHVGLTTMGDREAPLVAFPADLGQGGRGQAVIEHDVHQGRAALSHRKHHPHAAAPGRHRRAVELVELGALGQGV